MTAPREEARGPRESFLGPRFVAVAVLALGVLALVEGLKIPLGGGYAAVGPRAFPLGVAAGILLLGLLLLGRATVWPDRELARLTAEEEASTHWATVGFLAVLLVAYALVLKPLGYILATAAFLPVAARILGSRGVVRDVVAGLALAVVVYYGFTRFLGVRLPDGVLEPLL